MMDKGEWRLRKKLGVRHNYLAVILLIGTLIVIIHAISGFELEFLLGLDVLAFIMLSLWPI